MNNVKLQIFLIVIVLAAMAFAQYKFAGGFKSSSSGSSAKVATAEQPRQVLTVADVELHLNNFKAMQQKGMTVIDVRSPKDFAQKHLTGAINIPLAKLTAETLAAAVPDKKSPVGIMSDFSLAPTRSIAMALQAYPVFILAGYEKVYRLNLWVNPQGPIYSEKQIGENLSFTSSAEMPAPN